MFTVAANFNASVVSSAFVNFTVGVVVDSLSEAVFSSV